MQNKLTRNVSGSSEHSQYWEGIGTEIRGSWVPVPRENDFISRIEKP